MEKLSESDPSANRRLCIIGEADLFIARLLRRYALTCGLHAQCVQTGDEVLAWLSPGKGLQGGHPVVIVLDPELPGKVRGWEVIQALQAGCERLDPEAVIPFILCSWLGAAESQALVGQTAPHLQKPDLHYEDFRAALERVGVLPGTEDNRRYGGSR